jgi:hypothetical protein
MSNHTRKNSDLPDSENDKKHLQPEETTLDLPDVGDIPGQENIRVPKMGEFADTTASSADEEADELFGEEEDDLTRKRRDRSADVSREEKILLRQSANETPGDEEEADVREAALDSTDEDGTPLNEGNLRTDRFGEDLDLPEEEEVDEEDQEED